MGTIKRLPEAVLNTVRSGIILCDLTRVVEELVLNSLDAGATKVFVYVGVGTCYVKVVDDGSGISRDGLVLLGERYATSKLHRLADMDDAGGNFGFRGEALASISDVSLLEITTKAYGRPNGYRKVMKGSKCLHLGIDDERKDVGTTVVARELFYNQPVRRKCMQSSPKKVLHSVKKCVLRIALVHSKVSFKVIERESEDVLLCTRSSSSPLALLMSSFGIEDFSFLHEVNANDGAIKISGYISCPCDSISVKAFQYVYINSRFVCKGPIHKLLNHLAASFDCLDSWKANNGSLKRKRSKSDACPAYLLNLRCPQSLYDLSFEPSKTHVVFKDWEPVLTFIELAIHSAWMKNIAYGESSSCIANKFGKYEMWKKHDNVISAGDSFDVDMSEDAEFALESSRFENHQSSTHLLSSPLENLTKEGDHLFQEECERITFQEFLKDPVEHEEENTEMEFVSQPKYSFGLLDGSFAEWLPTVPRKIDHHALTIESSRFQDHQSSSHLLSPPLENLTKDGDHLFRKECERITFREFQKDPAELEEENTEMEYVSLPKYSFGLSDGSFAECLPTVSRKIDPHAWTSDNRFSLKGNYFLENNFLADRRPSIQVEGDLLSSQLGNEYLQIESGVSNEPSWSASSLDRDEFTNELEVSKDIKKPLPRSCLSKGSRSFDGALFAGGEERYESSIACFKYKRKRIFYDERIDILEADVSNQSSDSFSRTPWQGEASCSQYLPRPITAREVTTGFNLLPRASLNLFPSYAETKETNFLSDSIEPMGNSGSDHKALNSAWLSKISDPFSQAASWYDGHFTCKNALEGNSILGDGTSYGRLADTEENCKFNYDNILRRSDQEKCTSSSSGLGFEDCDHSSEDLYKCLQEHDRCLSREHSNVPFDKADWFCSVWSSKEYDNHESPRYKFRYHNCEPKSIHKDRSRRSHSAPPFHRNKRRYISLNLCSVRSGKPNAHTLHCAENSPEAGAFKVLQQSSGACNKPSSVEDFSLDITNKSNTMLDLEETQIVENFKKVHHTAQSEDFISKEIQDSIDSGTKWRNGCPQTTNNNISCDIHNQDNILDISSGLLHLAGDSLIPLSINKSCLEDAKVLQQVDKKFIPVVAGGTLAVIDQHAADERIQLEELRDKVLSGEGKSVTYLDAEQELVLPEIGYQLLHNYAEQIKDWGWICNFHTQGSRSFNKNLNLLHRQPTVVTLLAVPCILGVNLSDVDLLEFLQQLADTDGSSTTPPSVLRVLNSKACRGAIMFGDSLLPSECSLIVEELKQTSLCFQCAHGRPTTVPLVNLEALHKQIAELGALNDNSSELWRGLRRQEISLERASQRLSAARGYCY